MKLFTPTLAALVLGLSVTSALASPKVVTSIRPLHSLVSSVMEGIGEPSLLVDGNASPHGYTLKPSQAQELQDADLVFWVGPELEAFLVKPLETVAGQETSVPLIHSDGMALLQFPEGSGHDEHDAESGEHEHEHEENAAGEDHGDEEGHHHEGTDPHVWLDPVNAQAMTMAIAARLAKADPENGERYQLNAGKLVARLAALTTEVSSELAPLKGRPFIVFHDAYNYFGKRFGLERAAAITVNPEVAPGLAGATETHDRIVELGTVCVFSEPQFSEKLVGRLVEGTGARIATLDPLGYDIEAGPGQYEGLIREMASDFETCLGGK